MLQVNNAFARMDMVVISSGREHCGMVEKVGKKSANLKASLANDARYALIGYKHACVCGHLQIMTCFQVCGKV
jgi:hypothetical protein